MEAEEPLVSLYRAVGFVVLQWASAEQTLDAAVAILYQEFGGKRLAKRLPKQLDVKLRFVRKCLDLPELSAFKTEGGELIAAFESLSGRRHDLIHGAIASVEPVGTAFTFAKLDYSDPHIHTLRNVSFDAADFPKLADDLLQLGRDAAKFTTGLLRARYPQADV